MRWRRIRHRMRTRVRELRDGRSPRGGRSLGGLWSLWPEPLWARQTLICLAILAFVLLGKSLERFKPAAVTMNALRYTIGTDYDFRSAWAKLPSLETIGGGRVSETVTSWVDRLKSLLHLGSSVPQPVDHQMMLPVDGTISSSFGLRRGAGGKMENHAGLDITAPTGTEIVAALGGQVLTIATEAGYGKYLVIDHGQGLTTLYAHCSEILVQEKQEVLQGQVIAKVGQTGDADGPHVHFEVRLNGKAVDPAPWVVASAGS